MRYFCKKYRINMKKYVSLIAFLLMTTLAMAQSTGKQYLYRVYLTDKKGTPYSLKQPEKFLSPKAIERRKKQHLKLDATDLPVSPQYITAVEQLGVKVVSKSKWNNTLVVSTNDEAVAKQLQQQGFVRKVVKVWTSPDSVKYAKRYALTSLTKKDTIMADYYGAGQRQITMLGGDSLHAAGYTGRGITIAVVDGGFMNVDSIPSMQRIDILGSRDFVATGRHQLFDELDHGTSVLSCIAMKEPYLMVGTAPDASFWLLRSEDSYSESLVEEDYWAAAVEFADSVGADIISSSLGYYEFDDKSTSHQYKELNGRTALISCSSSLLAGKGIVHVNSAGNAGRGTWKKIGFPADAIDMLTVGAGDSSKKNAVFSSLGPAADGRVKPDVMAMGLNTAVVKGNGRLGKANGTSFSCPVTAGMVACLWQALPQKTAKEIIEIVRQNGDNYTTPDNVFGYGFPNYWQAYIKNK